jgi:hypothetical protein
MDISYPYMYKRAGVCYAVIEAGLKRRAGS